MKSGILHTGMMGGTLARRWSTREQTILLMYRTLVQTGADDCDTEPIHTGTIQQAIDYDGLFIIATLCTVADNILSSPQNPKETTAIDLSNPYQQALPLFFVTGQTCSSK